MECYLIHTSLLVAGLLLLTSDTITQEDIRNAELYLNEFYVKYSELYGRCKVNYLTLFYAYAHNPPSLSISLSLSPSFHRPLPPSPTLFWIVILVCSLYTGEKWTTMNVHLLSHLVDCVKCWGPLWAYSCFAYETMNGHLKKLFHGTKNMSKQVFSNNITCWGFVYRYNISYMLCLGQVEWAWQLNFLYIHYSLFFSLSLEVGEAVWFPHAPLNSDCILYYVYIYYTDGIQLCCKPKPCTSNAKTTRIKPSYLFSGTYSVWI